MAELIFICEICGMVLNGRHGNAICPNCGRTMDCSDLSTMPATGAVESDYGEVHFVPRPSGQPQQQSDHSV